jgi:hypothetical protein
VLCTGSERAPGMAHLPSFWRVAGSNKTSAVTGRKDNADKARAVSRNGLSEGSMRQNPCT